MSVKFDFSKLSGFDWDIGNLTKNQEKHGVESKETEEVFFCVPFLLFRDEAHSQSEERYLMFGKTLAGRKLTVCFTIRGRKIRIISARPQNRKERAIYEKKETESYS